MNRKLLLINALTLGAALLSASAQGSSCSGGDCSGGGASVCTLEKGETECGELLDAHMARNRFHVTKSELYKKRVEPILRQLEATVPDFAAELGREIEAKKWYLTNAPIKALSAETNGTELPTEQVAVQYQNSSEIWINKEWFNSRPEDEQLAIILHELGVGMYLRQKQAIKDLANRDNPDSVNQMHYRNQLGLIRMSDVRQLTELLLNQPLPKDREIQRELFELSFGRYLTAKDKEKFVKYKNELYREIDLACRLPDTEVASESPRHRRLGKILKDFGKRVSGAFESQRKKRAKSQEVTAAEEMNAHWLLLLNTFVGIGGEQFTNVYSSGYEISMSQGKQPFLAKQPHRLAYYKRDRANPLKIANVEYSQALPDQAEFLCETNRKKLEPLEPEVKAEDLFSTEGVNGGYRRGGGNGKGAQ